MTPTPKTPRHLRQSSSGSPKSTDKTRKTTLTLSIPPLKVLVKKQYLLNLEEGFGEYVEGSLMSVESYQGHLPTFTVLLSDGSIFAYLPVFAFVQEAISCSASDKSDHYPVFCPSDAFVYYEVAWLKKRRMLVFNPKKEKLPGLGSYLFSLEWPNENEQVHLVALNGQLYFVPNHKLLVTLSPRELRALVLPSWKKLRTEWTSSVLQGPQ